MQHECDNTNNQQSLNYSPLFYSEPNQWEMKLTTVNKLTMRVENVLMRAGEKTRASLSSYFMRTCSHGRIDMEITQA